MDHASGSSLLDELDVDSVSSNGSRLGCALGLDGLGVGTGGLFLNTLGDFPGAVGSTGNGLGSGGCLCGSVELTLGNTGSSLSLGNDTSPVSSGGTLLTLGLCDSSGILSLLSLELSLGLGEESGELDEFLVLSLHDSGVLGGLGFSISPDLSLLTKDLVGVLLVLSCSGSSGLGSKVLLDFLESDTSLFFTLLFVRTSSLLEGVPI